MADDDRYAGALAEAARLKAEEARLHADWNLALAKLAGEMDKQAGLNVSPLGVGLSAETDALALAIAGRLG